MRRRGARVRILPHTIKASVALEKDGTLLFLCDGEEKLKQFLEVFRGNLVKRNVPLRAVTYQKVEPATGMTGLELYPCPPHLSRDMLGAIVATLLAQTVGPDEHAIVLDSELDVAGEPCAVSFLLLPSAGGISELLAPLGLASDGDAT